MLKGIPMMITTALLLAAFWLAWSNGANDNFKGVATLYGSATCNFRHALAWASVASFLGSLASVYFAGALVAAFSGKGLIPDSMINSSMLTAVGASGAATILLSTFLGMPTSTTHALTGALIGTALVADSGSINWHILLSKYAQPLLLSPILAIGITTVVYIIMRRLRLWMGVDRQTCVCIGDASPQPVVLMGNGMAMMNNQSRNGCIIQISETDMCMDRYMGRFVGMNAQTAVDTIHYASAAAVCFARAVNDTPKIAALLMAGSIVGSPMNSTVKLLLVALAMTAGGLLQSRKVAETISKRITDLNCGQGLTANLVTAALVLGASRLGVPVSTTHVSCGSIFGIGLVNRQRRFKTVLQILATWLTTLPLGLALGAAFYWLLHQAGV